MVLHPSIGNLRPKKTDPETVAKIRAFFTLPPEWQEFVNYYKHRYQDAEDPVQLVRALYNGINPPTSSLGFKMEQPSMGKDFAHTEEMQTHTPEEVLKTRVGNPFTFAGLMIAALRESNIDANLSYMRPLQAEARDSDGNVKQGLVAVLLKGNVPEGLRYERFETDQKFRTEVAAILGPKAQELMKSGELHMLIVDFETGGKLGEQVKDLNVLSDPQAASIRYCNLGNYELKAGRREVAEQNYKSAKVLWPENPVVYECLARFNLTGGEDAKVALKDALRSVELEPQNPEAHRLMGEALMELGRPALAVKSLERSARLAPEDPAVHAALGDVYTELAKGTRKDSSREAKDDTLKNARRAVEEYAGAEKLYLAQGATGPQVRANLDAVVTAKNAAMQALAHVQQELGAVPTQQRVRA